MRRLIAFLSIALTITGVSYGQFHAGKVMGRVIDGNTKTVESATITLLRTKDSSVAKISVANKDGNFVFENVSTGSYRVSITAIGHTKGFSELFEIDETNQQVTLKTIELQPVSKNLSEVTVTARKPLIEQKIDRTIVNVEASVTNVGATALEVLEKSPGVNVDKDGVISLKGKPGVQVYIDGRPTYLSNTDLTNLLRSMNANQLDQIEIMTNPPAKYDAAGNAGIINIKTKKTKQFGYSGNISLSYGQGKYPKWSESANFNYRKNKVNMFATIGYGKRENFNNLDIQRKFIDANTNEVKSNFDQASRIKEDNSSYNAKAGLDFFATKKTTLGVVFTGFVNPGQFYNTSNVNISDENQKLLSITKASTNNDMRLKNFSTNLNFRHVFDSTGKEISVDADYIGYRRTNQQYLINSYYDPNLIPTYKPDTLLGNLPQDINILSAKVDYTHPISKTTKFEGGLKTSFVKTDNDAGYDSLLYGQIVPDYGRSNHFIYKENVNAAYVNLSKEFSKKFSGQFGLRLENTNSSGHTMGKEAKNDVWIPFDSTFTRDYTQLFPTMFIRYNMNEKNSFGLNYGRRIQRPNYEDLNPFIMFLDRYTFQQGNPNLQPQFAHNIELSHTYKGFLTTTLNYTQTTDIITDVLEQNTDKNQTFVKKSNVANQRQYGIAVVAAGPLNKWWTANIFMNVYNNLYKGVINNTDVKLGTTTGQVNITNQFKFGKTWAAELSGFYRTRGVEGVFEIGDFGMVNTGISKQIMKTKGTVRFSMRDVFYTQKINGKSQYGNIDAHFQQKRDSRIATINFTYRFSKGKVGNQRRRAGSASEEQSRVKTGEN